MWKTDLGTSVNFFHLDCLASEVRLNVDLDVALTVLANGCYRWLAHHLRGFDKPPQAVCIASSSRRRGQVEVQSGASSCGSIDGATIRSCARPRWTRKAHLSHGWVIDL